MSGLDPFPSCFDRPIPKLCGPDRSKPGFLRWTIFSFLSCGCAGHFRTRSEVRPCDQTILCRNEATGRPRLSRIAGLAPIFSSQPPKPDPMVDYLLIDMTLVKVKVFREFKRTRPSMSQCLFALQIDFPAIGLDLKVQRNLSKNATPGEAN